MTTVELVKRIGRDLAAGGSEALRESTQRFFKEKIKCHGLKSVEVRAIAQKYWPEVKGLEKEALFSLCEGLYSSGCLEEASIASIYLPRFADRFALRDLDLFKGWIERYMDNWAKCDMFCNHSVGDFIDRYPERVGELKAWTKSDNRWLRRAGAVSLIVPAKQGRFLKEVFEIADLLLADEDDMVRKGYGWLLKEASRLHRDEVFKYVVRNRRKMARTALRYAIELMPRELKSEAMKRP